MFIFNIFQFLLPKKIQKNNITIKDDASKELLYKSLKKNMDFFNERFKNSQDVVYRNINSMNISISIVYIGNG